MNAARTEAREILTKANRDSTQEMRQAESSGTRLLEQSRHQATELTNAARAEVEQTLEWARAQADVIVQRARGGAEQLLAAAGHGDPAIREAVDAIVRAAESTVPQPRRVPRARAARSRRRASPSPGLRGRHRGAFVSGEPVRRGGGPRRTCGRTTARRAALRLVRTLACRRPARLFASPRSLSSSRSSRWRSGLPTSRGGRAPLVALRG